jgi:hypothetical protein
MADKRPFLSHSKKAGLLSRHHTIDPYLSTMNSLNKIIEIARLNKIRTNHDLETKPQVKME